MMEAISLSTSPPPSANRSLSPSTMICLRCLDRPICGGHRSLLNLPTGRNFRIHDLLVRFISNCIARTETLPCPSITSVIGCSFGPADNMISAIRRIPDGLDLRYLAILSFPFFILFNRLLKHHQRRKMDNDNPFWLHETWSSH